jgi:hypothetical protein
MEPPSAALPVGVAEPWKTDRRAHVADTLVCSSSGVEPRKMDRQAFQTCYTRAEGSSAGLPAPRQFLCRRPMEADADAFWCTNWSHQELGVQGIRGAPPPPPDTHNNKETDNKSPSQARQMHLCVLPVGDAGRDLPVGLVADGDSPRRRVHDRHRRRPSASRHLLVPELGRLQRIHRHVLDNGRERVGGSSERRIDRPTNSAYFFASGRRTTTRARRRSAPPHGTKGRPERKHDASVAGRMRGRTPCGRAVRKRTG